MNDSDFKMSDHRKIIHTNHSKHVISNHNRLISSNKCQKTMLKTILQLMHNCRYVNTAAILLITLNILVSLSPCNAFLLDGSQNSFAQFRKWYTGLNGSLEFEFKTEQPNGLVLYTDDGGTFDFFEIKLVEGVVRLRYNLGGGANIITVGRELHDGHWHKVQVNLQCRLLLNCMHTEHSTHTQTYSGLHILFVLLWPSLMRSYLFFESIRVFQVVKRFFFYHIQIQRDH